MDRSKGVATSFATSTSNNAHYTVISSVSMSVQTSRGCPHYPLRHVTYQLPKDTTLLWHSAAFIEYTLICCYIADGWRSRSGGATDEVITIGGWSKLSSSVSSSLKFRELSSWRADSNCWGLLNTHRERSNKNRRFDDISFSLADSARVIRCIRVLSRNAATTELITFCFTIGKHSDCFLRWRYWRQCRSLPFWAADTACCCSARCFLEVSIVMIAFSESDFIAWWIECQWWWPEILDRSS